MAAYGENVERMMRRLFGSLNERDRRRYAAVEAAKLGHGGLEDVAGVLGCDPKAIRQEIAESETGGELAVEGQRKKGADANR